MISPAFDLVVVKGGEEAVPPAKGGVRVDEDVLVPIGEGEDFLKDGAAQGVKTSDGEIQNSARGHVGGFLIHHFADVTDLEVEAGLCGKGADGLQVRSFVYADLAGDDCAHVGGPAFGVAVNPISETV